MLKKLFLFSALIAIAFISGYRKHLFGLPGKSEQTTTTRGEIKPAQQNNNSNPIANQPLPSNDRERVANENDEPSNPYITMSPYLSPFYRPNPATGNNAQNNSLGSLNGPEVTEKRIQQRNLYFETLSKQMKDMQKEQEDEEKNLKGGKDFVNSMNPNLNQSSAPEEDQSDPDQEDIEEDEDENFEEPLDENLETLPEETNDLIE